MTTVNATSDGYFNGSTWSLTNASGHTMQWRDNFSILHVTGLNTELYAVGDSITSVDNTFLRLTANGAASTVPFDIKVGLNIDGTRTGTLPSSLTDDYYIKDILGSQEPFVQPSPPATGFSPGRLVGTKRVSAAVASGATLDVPLDWGALLLPMTSLSGVSDSLYTNDPGYAWDGTLYFTVWMGPHNSGASPSFTFHSLESGGTAPGFVHPDETLIRTNRDTGRSGRATASSPYGRSPVSGFASLKETWVPSGWLEGRLVDPRDWDPEEPEPRPAIPELPGVNEDKA